MNNRWSLWLLGWIGNGTVVQLGNVIIDCTVATGLSARVFEGTCVSLTGETGFPKTCKNNFGIILPLSHSVSRTFWMFRDSYPLGGPSHRISSKCSLFGAVFLGAGLPGLTLLLGYTVAGFGSKCTLGVPVKGLFPCSCGFGNLSYSLANSIRSGSHKSCLIG